MATKIEERFTVRASPKTVWAFLTDPRRVITCLPGAELTEVVDERTFHGKVKVRVGPVTVGYQGRIQMVELEPSAWWVRMIGEGRESGGAGAARMSMESRLTPQVNGATEVTVVSEVEIAGRLVQLGRGMIEQVSHQIFLEFAERVCASLDADAAATRGGSGLAQVQPPPKPEAVAALPLLIRALWAWLKSLFGRGPARR